MTQDRYAGIEMGMSVTDIEKLYGKPYSMHAKGDGYTTYEYIERVLFGNQILELRRYYIVISNGKVVDKYLNVSTPPAYNAIYSDTPYPDD